MAPKRSLQADSTNFSKADIKFLDREADGSKNPHETSSSDTLYSLEYDSDGFSDGSEDSKEVTWKTPRRKSRPVHKRRRLPVNLPKIHFEDDSASPQAPPQPQTDPAPATQQEELIKANDALQLRVATLEADYNGLRAYVEHLA